MKPIITNLVVFKIAWTVVVLSAAIGLPVFGLAAVAIAVGVHVAMSKDRQSEVLLLTTAAIMGLGWESALVATGLVSYPSGNWVPGMAPYWIVSMWVLFATTINVGMRWLRRSVPIAVVAGALGGPMAFFAGSSLGAVNFSSTALALTAIGLGWAVLLPLLVHVARRLDGQRKPVAQAA